MIEGAGLIISPGKCALGYTETRYLGYVLGNGEVCPEHGKVHAVRDAPIPTTKKEVRSFLGLVGYYRRFILDFATVAVPLTNLTRKNEKTQVVWTPECDQAFNALKEALCCSPVLRSPDFEKPFVVHSDASESGLGAVLSQEWEGEEHPVLYISRKLFPRETRYATVEKECLAIKWALESMRCYLLGRQFTLVTDHHALTWLNTMQSKNARVTRWYLAMQPFRFQIQYRPGRQHANADHLSRYGAGMEQSQEGQGSALGSDSSGLV